MAVYGDTVLLKVLTSAPLETAGFRHGFSTRRGEVAGVASGTKDALAAGFTFVGPTADANIFTLACSVGFDPASLYQANQVHGSRVVRVEGAPSLVRAEGADALVARAPRPLVGPPPSVGVRTADCVPVLVADRKTGDVAAIHAGWRGLEGGVIARGIEALGATSPEHLLVAIGPCIETSCFEVGVDVASRIAAAVSDRAVVHTKPEGPRDKAWVDLRLATRLALRALGIPDSAIDDVGGCTHCDPSLYFSYRRDGEKAGRHLSLIVADKR